MKNLTNAEFYLDWTNNYLTTTKMASDYNMSEEEVCKKIDLGRIDHEKNAKFKPATYSSVWDNGDELITNCLYNPETKEVKDIENADADAEELNILMDEYVTFKGEDIRDFINLDN